MNIEKANKVLAEADLLVSEAEVAAAIKRMAQEITGQLKESCPVLLCVMNGGLIFTGQLLTSLVFPLEVDYVHATRYGHEINGVALAVDRQAATRPEVAEPCCCSTIFLTRE